MTKQHSILVVDDDPEIVTLLSTRLTKRGYKITTASDGARALELARSDKPDLVICDLTLEPKNGYDICRAIKQQSPSVPVLVLSSKFQFDIAFQPHRFCDAS